MGYIEAKVRSVARKLRALRAKRMLRLNINLFKVLVMPWVRMGATNMVLGLAGERLRFMRTVRRWFREFCGLPRGTPNTVVRWLLGDLEGMFEEVQARAEMKDKGNRGERLAEEEGARGWEGVRGVPDMLL